MEDVVDSSSLSFSQLLAQHLLSRLSSNSTELVRIDSDLNHVSDFDIALLLSSIVEADLVSSVRYNRNDFFSDSRAQRTQLDRYGNRNVVLNSDELLVCHCK